MEKQNEKSENEPDSDLPLLRKETEMSKKKEDILEHHQPSSKRGRGRNKGSAPTKQRLPEFMLPMLERKMTAKDLRKKERLEHHQPSSKRGRGRNKGSAPTKQRLPEFMLPMLERKMTAKDLRKKEGLEHHQPSSSKRGRRRNNRASPRKQGKIVENKTDSKEKEIVLTRHLHVLLERLPVSMLPILERKTAAEDLRKKRKLEHHQPSSKRGRGRNKGSAPTKLRLPEFMLPMLERKMTAKDLRKKEGLEHHQPSSSKRGRRRNNRASPTKQGKIVENKTDSKEKEIVLTRHLHVLLERLPESMLPILERKTAAEDLRKKGELEHHQPSSSKQSTERKTL
ncbi:hypothetical protein HNY73_011105 [Argiope bruennichi]|uniref:Uncharacterized protein n=1 Tax=Argiope bruennichi TaxID=94029 RepID=A0A8T0F352_ARGBR|nr:hypothetical protein HNY73_011105 [Argiope bruennichi]